MPQVVTSANMQQLIETGSVDAFVAPEAAKPVVIETQRGPDGKFVAKADPETPAAVGALAPEVVDKTQDKGNITDAAKAEDDDGDDPSLPEKVRRKIGVKHRQMREAEEFAEREFNDRKAAERRAEQAETKLRDLEAKSRPATVVEDKPPKPEDFATVAEYTDALTDYKVEKKFKAEEERRATAAQEKAEQTRMTEYGQRMTAVQKEHPDFDKVMASIKGSAMDSIPKVVSDHLVDSELGPQLVYHLAKNPETLDRLRKLSPTRFIAELGKLEMKLEKPAVTQATPAETPVSVSKAPAPIAPLDGKSSPVIKDPAKMNFQELREYRRQEEASRAGRR